MWRGALGTISVIFLSVFFGCNSGSGGGGGEEGELLKEIVTKCGVVKEQELVNPVSVYDSQQATLVRVIGTTILEVQRLGATTTEYIVMFGLSPSRHVSKIKSALSSHVGQTIYLVKPNSEGCQVTVRGGSILNSYQVISDSGINFSEDLVAQGLSELSTSTSCGENLFVSCVTDPTKTGGDSSAKKVSNFLWKPNSESPYNPGGVSVLLNPCDVDVFINGEAVRDYGAGNGRCVTARSPHPGCDFGTNVEVKAIDRATGKPVLFGTATSFIVPNGCERTEFAGDGQTFEEEEALPPCDASTSDLEYRPTWVECGGNAGVLMSGEFGDAFNSALRMPDNSDRLDISCAESGCSPYKTQGFVDMTGAKLACFGAAGSSPLMSEVVQVSVKREGDDHDPYRECLADPSQSS